MALRSKNESAPGDFPEFGEPEFGALDANPGPADVALYIADLTGQMASMARAANLELLAYFLAMAQAEANAVLNPDAKTKVR